MKIHNVIATMVIAMVGLSGCATIVGEPDQLVPVSSSPSAAQVVISDETGKEVYRGTTPASVTLEKSDGSYWGGKDYVVEISKDGYESQNITIESHANGWYIAGNLVFGGLIGWFIVDPLNGDMYTLSPKAIEAELPDSVAHQNGSADGGISVVLLSEVPPALRDELQPLSKVSDPHAGW